MRNPASSPAEGREQALGARPWYREPWVWGLAAGPAAVVAAGFATLWIAFKSDDGLVVEDYYKQGLAIHQVLDRERSALRRGVSAEVRLEDDGRTVVVGLTVKDGPLPTALVLKVIHPTRAGYDQTLRLLPAGGHEFRGALAPLSFGRWVLNLEDERSTWRLTGSFWYPERAAVRLTPPPAAS
ncbi:FixH family protein [Pelomicrobium sp.]|jgi:hypothetical protein|uniref:FixH family protein n=1 Tax=Pelomicrobium sp. TaxID=2815319 RepID=UPI002FDCCEB7